MTLYCYPKCTTCRGAAKWLNDHDFTYEYIDIKQAPPSAEELKRLHTLSGLPLSRFFNTSGNSYRALGLAGRLAEIEADKLYQMLSEDGMLIKRPLLVTAEQVLVGFKPDDWANRLLGDES